MDSVLNFLPFQKPFNSRKRADSIIPGEIQETVFFTYNINQEIFKGKLVRKNATFLGRHPFPGSFTRNWTDKFETGKVLFKLIFDASPVSAEFFIFHSFQPIIGDGKASVHALNFLIPLTGKLKCSTQTGKLLLTGFTISRRVFHRIFSWVECLSFTEV